jgi:hypothetical protein
MAWIVRIFSVHVGVSEPHHSARKLINTGLELLVIQSDPGAATITCKVRMDAKISNRPDVSRTAGTTNDFYRHVIRCIFLHVPSSIKTVREWHAAA